ncbi:hypothetical protein vseg_007216 [Gypsophila vaccaria]
MTMTPLMMRSLVRLVSSLASDPMAAVSTLLYYSHLLPRHLNLERFIRRDLLHPNNYLFHFLINFLRCL